MTVLFENAGFYQQTGRSSPGQLHDWTGWAFSESEHRKASFNTSILINHVSGVKK